MSFLNKNIKLIKFLSFYICPKKFSVILKKESKLTKFFRRCASCGDYVHCRTPLPQTAIMYTTERHFHTAKLCLSF